MIKKKKRVYRIISIISVIGFIFSTIALLYPVVSDRWNRMRDAQLVTNYNKTLAGISTDKYDKLFRMAQDYNNELRLHNRNIITDADYDPDSYYETLLNPAGNSMMGYVEIPKIDVTEPIYHYSTEISLGKGVGHIHGSSLPVGGKNTHTVLTGHRGLPTQKFFSDLDKVNIGDMFYIHVLGKVLAYKIYEIREIEPTNVEMLFLEDGKDLATLVTCTPYGINTERLIVMGERVEFDEEIQVDDKGHVMIERHQMIIDPAIWVFIGFMIFTFIIFSATVVRNVIYKKKSKEKEKNRCTS